MIVRHQKASEFFDDLKLAKANASREPLVRLSVYSEAVNKTTSENYMIAGFLDDECLYELRVDADVTYSESDHSSAVRELESLKESLSTRCEQIGVKSGGGRWLLE